MTKKALVSMIFSAALALSTGLAASGSEHPAEQPTDKQKALEHPAEHPAEKQKASEHPADHDHSAHEHPEANKTGNKLSIEDVANSVRKYITVDSKAKGGYFMVWDSVKDEPLALKLDKIHEDRLSPIGGDTYFVCADFKATNGKTYDLDFFMKDNGHGGVKVTDVVTVHKESGKARYGWAKKDDKWVKTKP